MSDNRPASASHIHTLMSYGIYEPGRKYTYEESLRMVREVKDAGYEADESKVDNELVAKIEATDHLNENQKDLEPRLLEYFEEYDNSDLQYRGSVMSEAVSLEVEILQNYAWALQTLRSYEWKLALNNQSVSGEIKILVGRSEASLKQAVNDFRGRWNKYYQKFIPTPEEFIQEHAQLQHLSDFRDSNKETLDVARKKQYERNHPPQRKSSGCLVLLLPFIIFAVIYPFITG